MTGRRNRTWAVGLAAMLAAAGCATSAPESRAPTREEIARLDAWYADIFTTGPVEANWDREGADPFAGAERWLLLTDAAGRRQLLIPGAMDARALVPRSWRRLREWREPGARRGTATVQIQPLDARYILVAAGGYRREGTAFCAEGGAMLALYERPAPASEFTGWEAETLAGYLFGRAREEMLCMRYDELGGGRYGVRNFDDAGRPLVTLDLAREVAAAVEPGDVEALLGLD